MDRLGQGVPSAAFDRGGQLQNIGLGQVIPHDLDRRYLGLTQGQGAGFVKDHRIEVVDGFETVAAANQQAALGPQARTHQDRGGGRQTQGTGAGDDHDGDRQLQTHQPGR